MHNRAMTVIDFFDGTEYDFLSNFHEGYPTVVNGITFPTTEHAFQAYKASMVPTFTKIARANGPGAAKGLGRSCVLRADWETIKVPIMKACLMAKFTQHPELRKQLLATGTKELIEGNVWHDNFWGRCECEECHRKEIGLNMLGNLLMEVREILR